MPGSALTLEEREEIRAGIVAGEAAAGIARRLGRSPSTVSREIDRNGGRQRYCASVAQQRAVVGRGRPRLTKFQANPDLARRVELGLEAFDSPTTIARQLAGAGGIDGVTVSAETIYQAVYSHGTRGLPAGLHDKLHRRRRRRKPRCRPGEKPKKPCSLGVFNLITTRPEIAETRREVGHFEGDLIIGAAGKSAIVTVVDRASRFNLLGHLPAGHDADSVRDCLIGLFHWVPVELRKTLTWDQGSEMARHAQLAATVGIDVYFAEPHSPWMRPTNENFNGLLRRYVGKGTDLSIFTPQDLHRISCRINNMPRRSLKWNTARNVYNAAISAPTT